MIVLLLLLPSMLMALLSLPSLAIGVTISCALILLASLANGVSFRVQVIVPGILLVSAIWAFAVPVLFGVDPQAKQVVSMISMTVCNIGCGMLVARKNAPTRVYVRYLVFGFFGLGFLGALGIFHPGVYADYNKPVFPFIEPSHFALAITPLACAASCMTKSRLMKLSMAVITLLLGIALPNLTLVIAAGLISLISLDFMALVLFTATTAVLFFSLTQTSPDLTDYFIERLMQPDSQNLSSLVYFQGWENMFSAFVSTNGWGVGYQNLGIEPAGQSSLVLESLGADALNRLDGGFLAAKIIGEFGLLGLLVVLAMTIIALRCGSRLRRLSKSSVPETINLILALAFGYTMLIELFVRGVGYFSPTLVIYLAYLPLMLSPHISIIEGRLPTPAPDQPIGNEMISN